MTTNQRRYSLINEYSIAWEFCGNNTKAKIKIANLLNIQLKDCERIDKEKEILNEFLPQSVIEAMERAQQHIVDSQPLALYKKDN